tara:strand:- start:27 stop:896 length:870 start_codon:yes stop_codon:yes gene_type:complete
MIQSSKYLRYVCVLIPLIVSSCSFFDKPYIWIDPNSWSDKNLYFSDLDDNYKRTKNFNRIWSKLYSDRFTPYHKLLDKKYTIIGTYNTFNNEYLVIGDQKGNRFKMVINLNEIDNNVVPSYFLFEDVLSQAKKMIGKTIWLNNTLDPNGFYTFSEYNFTRFEPVKVLDVFPFQNLDYDHPVWLKTKASTGDEGFVRYNGDEGRVGIQDHYYNSEPLPYSWGRVTINKIVNKQIELGMTERQVRIAIGNPDEVNSTSSRHGISEQWIYRHNNSKDVYYQFEYEKLIFVNK